MKLPKVITHKNLDGILHVLEQDYATVTDVARNQDKWNVPVYLEFPLGEIAETHLKTICLVGFAGKYPHQTLPIDGTEGFSAQGIEGKMRVSQPLFNALINLRDNLPCFRGRILTEVQS